jgi:hypothetical protein
MNVIYLSAPTKSLRQIPHSSYNPDVENQAQAPRLRLFHFSGTLLPFTRAAKPSICNNLHTIKSALSASRSFLTICALSEKHRGYTPKLPVLEPRPFTRIRFPERGPSRKLLAPSHPQDGEDRAPSPPDATPHPCHHEALGWRLSIFTCNKKAICPTLNGNAPTSNDV